MTTSTANIRGVRRTHRRLGFFAAPASAMLATGLILAGCTSESEAAGAADVLAEYDEARNAVEADDPESLDALMALYAPDAVVTGHPVDRSVPPVATGVEEIRALEAQVPELGRDDYATEFFDVEASGGRASFHSHFFNVFGECFSSDADAVTVEDGLITSFEWGARDESGALVDDICDPERLAQTYDNGMSVEYAGDACVYAGPTEFSLGDRFDITARDVTAAPADVGYAIGKAVDGTTVADAEQAQQEGGADPFIDDDSGTYLFADRTSEDRYMSTTLDVAGTWLLYCFIPDGGAGEQIYSTIIEVAD